MIALDRCDNLAVSISPSTLQNVINSDSFTELVSCLEKFAVNYAKSREDVDVELIKVFRSVVRPAVEAEGLRERYFGKLVFYRKLADYKIRFALTTLAQFQHICEYFKQVSEERTESSEQGVWITRNGLLCSCLSQLFFSIEHSSKIACSLTDDSFAKKVAKGIVVSHGDVFRILKRMGRKGFALDFDALTKIYAYAIKTRMAADYTEFFYEEFDVQPFLSLLTQVANDIFNSQKDLLFQCTGI